MVPAIALLTIGYILLRAGWFKQSLTEAALGKVGTTPRPVFDPSNVTEQRIAGGSLAGPPAPNSPAKMGGGVKSFDGKPVARWIIPWLTFARRHGWKGVVTSGYRDPNVVVTPSPGLPVAPQGQSNHNKTTFPGGAVDVSDPEGLEHALKKFPGPVPLRRDPAIRDPIHFSATGR